MASASRETGVYNRRVDIIKDKRSERGYKRAEAVTINEGKRSGYKRSGYKRRGEVIREYKGQ